MFVLNVFNFSEQFTAITKTIVQHTPVLCVLLYDTIR